MSSIAYDPIKDKFAAFIRRSRFFRRIFYFILDLFFLRGWHLRRLIKKKGRELDKQGEWTLLDAGCGFGQYDRFVLSRFDNVNVTSIDVKEDYLADCKYYFRDEIEKGRVTFENQDLLELEYSEKFDMVICIDVLEHIEEDVEAIRQMNKSLKKKGYFIMHSPSHYSEEDADSDDSFVGEHARAGYSKEDISEKIETAGLTPRKVHYTYGRLGHLAWVLSIKYPMLWFNKFGMATFLLLLIYYPVVMPFCLLFNYVDLFTKNEKGNGIYALAEK